MNNCPWRRNATLRAEGRMVDFALLVLEVTHCGYGLCMKAGGAAIHALIATHGNSSLSCTIVP